MQDICPASRGDSGDSDILEKVFDQGQGGKEERAK
jgi:hypothetical protein